METFGDKLRAARTRKGMKQAEVAALLDCAPTSLTNWESGKIQPSVEVLARLCEVLEISPLDLLSRKYTYDEIVKISGKAAYERSYEEQIALNFSRAILEKLMPAELQRKEVERVEKSAAFLRDNAMLDRFGGTMDRAEIEPLLAEYDAFGGADRDILFAYHALNPESKGAVLAMLSGLLLPPDNVQPFNDRMSIAVDYTIKALLMQRDYLQEIGEVQ